MMVNMQFKTFSINLNDHDVNGMTPFDLVLHSGKLVIESGANEDAKHPSTFT